MPHPRVNGSLSPCAIRLITLHYSKLAGLGPVAPHDLRRTHAKLAREGGASLEIISASLGHSSVLTTQRYLGTCDTADAGSYFDLGIDNVKGEESK